MPFAVTRPQRTGMPPLYAVRERDGDWMWDARKRLATPFTEQEADALVASFNQHSDTELLVVGLRNTVESSNER